VIGVTGPGIGALPCTRKTGLEMVIQMVNRMRQVSVAEALAAGFCLQ
jgi:hypothetical protein